MRIALVAPSSVPFTVGGAEKLWWGLQAHINRHTDHPCELIKLPAAEGNLPDLVASYRRFAALDLTHFDRVISTKYPAWMLSHPCHIVYLQHRLRGLYDSYPWPDRVVASAASPWRPEAWPDPKARHWLRAVQREPAVRDVRRLLESAPARSVLEPLFAAFFELAASDTAPSQALLAFPGPLARAIVHWLDSVALAPEAIRRYFAISRTVAQREFYFPPGCEVRVQPHPSNLEFPEPAQEPAQKHAQQPAPGAESDPPVFFTASRLDGPKRLDLLINAFSLVPGDVELHIAGTGPEQQRLATLAATDPRVRLLGFLRDDQIVAHYGRALAVPFVPYQEDMGLITLEAMRAGRPVITCTDSGGPNEWVRHGLTGWAVPPEPKALAEAMQAALAQPRRTRAMGRLGRMHTRGITWSAVADTLLDTWPAPAPASAPASVPVPVHWRRGQRFVVLNTFSCHPPRGGGQQRCFHLYRHLAELCDGNVIILVLDSEASESSSRQLAPGVEERVIPLSDAARARLRVLTEQLDTPIGDLFAMRVWHEQPAFVAALRNLLTPDTIGIAAHVYLAEALQRHHRGRWWYDAYNVELDLKREILAPGLAVASPEARAWALETLERLADIEAMACRESSWVGACSQADWDRFRELQPLPADKGIVIPNCADVSGVAFVGLTQRREWQRRVGRPRPVALFVGSWHVPNLEAAEWLIHELAPACPEIDFVLVGSQCAGLAGAPLPPNLRCVGVVSDAELRVLLALADVGLNPVTRGSGSNLKMLDYAAVGLPVLTTPFGRRGIALSDKECWVAERRHFAAALRGLLQCPDAELAAILVEARRRIEREHDWRHAAQRMLQQVGVLGR